MQQTETNEEIKVGDIVEVINIDNHSFPVGGIAEIVRIDEEANDHVPNLKNYQYAKAKHNPKIHIYHARSSGVNMYHRSFDWH